MELFKVKIPMGAAPVLDPDFIPLFRFNQAFLATATEDFEIALEGSDGQMSVRKTKIHGTKEMADADEYYLRRLLKTMIWLYGGFRFHLKGNFFLIEKLKSDFSLSGIQKFDVQYMEDIYEMPFEIKNCTKIPDAQQNSKQIGRNLDGCRIGFDAGGSDRKVCAVEDGIPIFSEEIVWFPKINSDPNYHYEGIVEALRSAANHLPRVDGVGISSAGIYINNQTMKASLFLKVEQESFKKQVKNIYQRAVFDVFGDKMPFQVVNDGDVTALAGAMNLEKNSVLGIAMGTSQAVGFVDKNGCITGWLNELAFVPMDASPNAMRDEWSGDIGCGVKYFSQDAVIKLAEYAGICLKSANSPAEKLKIVQSELENNNEKAESVFSSMGIYLAESLVYYYDFYHFEEVLLLGRVMSGKGGDIILKTATSYIEREFPTFVNLFHISLPDEKSRRVGQAVAAASLPKVN